MAYKYGTPSAPTGTVTDVSGVHSTACGSGTTFEVDLNTAGANTLNNPTDTQEGQTYTWLLQQDAVTPVDVSFGDDFLFAGGASPTVTQTASAVDILRATAMKDASGNIKLYSEYEANVAAVPVPPAFTNTYSTLLTNPTSNVMHLIAGSSSDLDLDGSSDLSFSFWVKPAVGGSTVNRYIFAKQVAGTLCGFDCYTGFYNDLSVRLRDASGNYRRLYQTSVSPKRLTAGSWHHVALVWEASGQTLAIYTGGAPDAAVNTQNVGVTVGSVSNSDTFTLGKATRVSGVSYTNGNIDEFAIYNGLAFSASDVTALYNSGSPTGLTGLLSQNPTNWWRMGDDASDDLTGTTGQVTDVAGSVNLTPMGTVAGDKVTDVP